MLGIDLGDHPKPANDYDVRDIDERRGPEASGGMADVLSEGNRCMRRYISNAVSKLARRIGASSLATSVRRG